MKRKITVLFFLLFLPTFVLAGTVGKIKGKVTDLQTGEVLIGANVIVVGTSFGAATDVNGEFVINNLDAGVYRVKASYLGYKTVTVSDVRVNADLTTELDFQLPPTGVSVGEVEIVAKRPLINKSNTNAIRVTTNADIEALPVRGIDNILKLTPGVVLQDNNIYVRGGRQDEVGYYLEGTNITNPMYGGRAVTIPQDALEEITVQAGGYTAEFGGANAGIVRSQLKSGGPSIKASLEYITDNISFKGRDARFDGQSRLGAYWYGYSEFTGTLSGPLFAKNIKFFGLFNSRFMNDANPQPFPGMSLGRIGDASTGDTINFQYPAGATFKNSDMRYNGTGTLTFDFNPIIFRLVGTYTTSDYFTGNVGQVTRILDLNRVPEVNAANGAFNLKMTHILSPNTYYELNAGYSFSTTKAFDPYLKDNFLAYGDSVANANAGVPWVRRQREIDAGRFGQYLTPLPYQIYSFSFAAPNDILSDYSKTNRSVINLSGSFSSELSKEHSIKFGGELQMWNVRGYSANGRAYALAQLFDQNDKLPAGDPNKLTHDQIMISQGVNNYGYDLYGNSYTGATDYAAGKIAPKKPTFAGVYFEDKIEYKNLIVNAGLRYDYINTDNDEFVDPAHPELAIDKNTGEIYGAGLKKVPSFSALSPRLGFSFPVTDQTVFHAQYGKFVQQTRLRDEYQCIYTTSFDLRGGFFISTPIGYNIRPTRTTQYELGFTQQIGEFASVDITGYYKDILDEVVFNIQPTASGSAYGSYNTLANGDFATTKGVEVSFNMRRTQRLLVNGSISFQDARGTGSYPNQDAGIVGAPLDGVTIYKPERVTPLSFNRSFSGNLSLDYHWGRNDGPNILHQFGASALLTFAAGHPFTRGIGKGNNQGSLAGDSRFRQPIEPLNASVTPSVFQVDLRIDKTFSIWDKLNANIYIYVINLFDTKNAENVFLRTGSPTDDGYLSDPGLGGQLVEKNGQDYARLYRAINIDYFNAYQSAGGQSQFIGSALMWGPPRQIRLGVRLEY